MKLLILCLVVMVAAFGLVWWGADWATKDLKEWFDDTTKGL